MLLAQIDREIKEMNLRPLSLANFEDFVRSAEGLFVPGARYHELVSEGQNSDSEKMFDFTFGKPEYKIAEAFKFSRLQRLAFAQERSESLRIFSTEGRVNTWISAEDYKAPQFGLFPGKLIYIRETHAVGTPEKPWETIYVRTY